jgi:transposase, IS6 family
MILSAIAERLKRRSKDDFKGRHFEASLIVQAVSWYLRYPLSYRDIEELFLERGLAVDHATLNRWVLAYAPLIERRLRFFRKPHCGSVPPCCTDRADWGRELGGVGKRLLP